MSPSKGGLQEQLEFRVLISRPSIGDGPALPGNAQCDRRARTGGEGGTERGQRAGLGGGSGGGAQEQGRLLEAGNSKEVGPPREPWTDRPGVEPRETHADFHPTGLRGDLPEVRWCRRSDRKLKLTHASGLGDLETGLG